MASCDCWVTQRFKDILVQGGTFLMVSLEFTSLYTFSILANMMKLTYVKLAMSINALKRDA